MAAPNIVNVATITGKTTQLSPGNTSENVLVANPSGSNKVFKINSVIGTNISNIASVSGSVGINSADDGSGNTLSLASAITVPNNSAIVFVDKNTSFYLEEDKSVVVISSVSSNLIFTTSYEELS
jgi:hypothetical protein